jgi:hypothetical protein
LDPRFLIATLGSYQANPLVQFLFGAFPGNRAAVIAGIRDYLVGTHLGFTVFPTISRRGKLCKAKLVKFDAHTGKRLKGKGSISSLEHFLKRNGDIPDGFETDKEVFFGEHLLGRCHGRTVAIVEAEKTALVASIHGGIVPNAIWLATGSKHWLKYSRLRRIPAGTPIIVYPDADAYQDWSRLVKQAAESGLHVKVSSIIERLGSDLEKSGGWDLADYILHYPAQTDQLKQPANVPDELQTLYDELYSEREAVMLHDGHLAEVDISSYLRSRQFHTQTMETIKQYMVGARCEQKRY